LRISGRALLFYIGIAGWLVATAIAMLLVARLGPFGVGLIGLLVWFICVRVDLEREGAVGSPFATGLYAQQARARQEMTRSERAALRDEHSILGQSLRFGKHLGMAMTVIGMGLFAMYQL
jgi:hypothetical protein